MEKLIFLSGILFLVVSCVNPENYASIPDEHIERQASTAQRDIQELVAQTVASSTDRIGSKKRRGVDIKETIGGKDLGKGEGPNQFTNVNVTNVMPADEEAPAAEKKEAVTDVSEESCKKDCEKKEKQLDILVYMHSRDSDCVSNFLASAKKDGFLGHFSPWDWQLSFSYYTEEANLMALEYFNGRPNNTGGFKQLFDPVYDYVLSEEEYPEERRDRYFFTTLERTKYIAQFDEYNNEQHTPDSNKYVNNPLAGIDHTLTSQPEGFARKDSQVFVLFFGDQFPYYFAESWKNFFAKHKNVNILSVSRRDANISNFVHAYDYDQFDVLPECSPLKVVEKINHHLK